MVNDVILKVRGPDYLKTAWKDYLRKYQKESRNEEATNGEALEALLRKEGIPMPTQPMKGQVFG